ncbi:MAG: helix-turn-helix transcriptional regulator [Sneathiella sp.]|nr:helix-turn-helix transcriptional regulator [Sneathiella sp.]
MSRANLSTQTCTVARSVALVGDEWTFMIIRELFLGNNRFGDFLSQTGMSSHLLSQRLKKLETEGVIQRKPYSERPPRYEYHLTAMGRDLWPAVIALKQWGDRWLSDGEVPVEIIHKGCGHITQPQVTCSECGEPMAAHDSEPHLSQSILAERQTARTHS